MLHSAITQPNNNDTPHTNTHTHTHSWYGSSLNSHPLRTKTLTSLLLMTLSFYTGSVLSPTAPSVNPTSLKTSPLFLLLVLPGIHFPITSHYYYTWINKTFPGRGLKTTLLKSLIGQLSYGPLYTSIFFLSQLVPLSPPALSLPASVAHAARHLLIPKLASDFFPVWRSGVFYWVTVDVLSFSFVPTKWITGFVNLASYFWTVILCVMARA